MTQNPPEVRIESLEAGAAVAEGVVVVIDVFRAFTTAALAMARGAAGIVMVGEIETALALKAEGAVDLCLGERHGAKPEGFELGNSPAGLAAVDLKGKRLALTTSNGTRGLIAARHASRLYAGALVNAEATVAAILAEAPSLVSLVAIGARAGRAVEDELCALYLRSRFQGIEPDRRRVAEAIAALAAPIPESLIGSGDYPHEDRVLALGIDTVPVALPLKRAGDNFVTLGPAGPIVATGPGVVRPFGRS